MKATIRINMDNAAFENRNGTELARILRRLAAEIEGEILPADKPRALRDVNGNSVGFFSISE